MDNNCDGPGGLGFSFEQHPILGSAAESTNIYFLICFIVLMLFFFVMAALIESYHPKYGHETGYTIVFGVILSLIIYACIGSKVANTFKFSSNLFFNFFLPPIIFNSGFNMRKKKFF